jgi:hypothetical protein
LRVQHHPTFKTKMYEWTFIITMIIETKNKNTA